jgi:hypothetical protein
MGRPAYLTGFLLSLLPGNASTAVLLLLLLLLRRGGEASLMSSAPSRAANELVLDMPLPSGRAV